MALFPLTKLKTDNGVVRTKSLFYELSYSNQDDVIFTLKEQDTETESGAPLLSLQRLFVEHTLLDPSEYHFSQHVFGSWDVWERLCKAPQLAKHIESWRREADVKRKSLAFTSVVNEVQHQGKNAFAAAKFLIDEPWKGKGSAPADKRKTRALSRDTAEEAFEKAAIDDDLKRLREEGLIQ